MDDPTAIAIVVCTVFGYGFFLGRWAGRREGRLHRKRAGQLLRALRKVARRKGLEIEGIDPDRFR